MFENLSVSFKKMSRMKPNYGEGQRGTRWCIPDCTVRYSSPVCVLDGRVDIVAANGTESCVTTGIHVLEITECPSWKPCQRLPPVLC